MLREGGVKLAPFQIPNLMSAVMEEYGQSLSLTSPWNIHLARDGLMIFYYTYKSLKEVFTSLSESRTFICKVFYELLCTEGGDVTFIER